MKTGSHSDRSERTTGEPETAETAARQPDGSAASPATRSRRQIDGSALTSNRISLPRVTVMGRQLEDTEPDYMAYYTSYEVARDALITKDQEIERLREALERYGRHGHPNCHDLTLKEDGRFGPRNGCLCGLDTALSGRSSPETSAQPLYPQIILDRLRQIANLIDSRPVMGHWPAMKAQPDADFLRSLADALKERKTHPLLAESSEETSPRPTPAQLGERWGDTLKALANDEAY